MTQGEKRICGAILAGGGSTRMGRPKQDMPLADGRAMIEHVHDALACVCDDVVIVGQSAALRAVRRIEDRRTGCGPLGGIETLLSAVGAEQYLVVPCDIPRITPEGLGALLAHRDCAATMFVGHPLPARLSRDVLPTVSQLLDGGQRAVHRLLDAVGAMRLEIDGTVADALVNVNDPNDLARMQRQ